MDNLKNILENSKLKVTPQRLAILKELEQKGHASIEEVYDKIKTSFPSISLATIYKNINSLKEEGIISEVCLHQKPKYELTKEAHAHFVCKKCGKVIDIPLKDVIKEEIEKEYPNSQKELYIYGICEDCNNKK